MKKEKLQMMFRYEKITGRLIRFKKGRGRQKSLVAGANNGNERLRVMIDGTKYYVHRLIFLYHYGYMPKFVDHIDGNPKNNRIENLQKITLSQNNMKSKDRKGREGLKGVSFNKHTGLWHSRIGVNGENVFLGAFLEKSHALQVRIKAERELFKGYLPIRSF